MAVLGADKQSLLSEKNKRGWPGIPQLHTADNPRNCEEEPQNIYSNDTSVRQ